MPSLNPQLFKIFLSVRYGPLLYTSLTAPYSLLVQYECLSALTAH